MVWNELLAVTAPKGNHLTDKTSHVFKGNYRRPPTPFFFFYCENMEQNSTQLFFVARLTVETNWSFVINKCDNLWSTSAMPVFEPFAVMTVGVTIRATLSQHKETC